MMNMHYRYTRQQVARGARADAERNDALFLLKNVSELRLTYQIRLLTYQAIERGCKLIVRVPEKCKVHSALKRFQNEHQKVLRIEKV
jgi:hypothetical protein